MHKYSLYKHDTTLNSSGTDTPLRTHPLMSKSAVNTTSPWIQKLWAHNTDGCPAQGKGSPQPSHPPPTRSPHSPGRRERRKEPNNTAATRTRAADPLPRRKHGALGASQRRMQKSVVTMGRRKFWSNTFSECNSFFRGRVASWHKRFLGEGYTETTRSPGSCYITGGKASFPPGGAK